MKTKLNSHLSAVHNLTASTVVVVLPVLLLATSFLLQASAAPVAQQGQSTNYRITADVVGPSGRVSSSMNHLLWETIGQPADSGELGSTNHRLYAGFTYALGALDDHDNSCLEAQPLAVGELRRGTLASNSDVDFYRVHVTLPHAAIRLHLFHPTRDYDLVVYDADCDVALKPGDIIGWAHNIGEEMIDYHIGSATGDYVVAVTHSVDSVAPYVPYELEVNVTPDTTNEPNDSCETASNAPSNMTGYIASQEDKDFYEIDVPPSEDNILNLRLYHPTKDLRLQVFGPDCAEKEFEWGRNIGDNTGHYEIGSESGPYYVAVVGYDGDWQPDLTIPYILEMYVTSSSEMGEPNDTCDLAITLEDGIPATGYIHSADDVDYYAVNIDQPYTVLNLDLDDPTADYDLDLHYGCPAPTTSTIGEGAEVTFNVGKRTGAYFVRVSSREGAYDPSAQYSLELALGVEASGEPNGLCEQAFEAVPNNTYRGYITDPADRDIFKVGVDTPYTLLELSLDHATDNYKMKLVDCFKHFGWAHDISLDPQTREFNVGREVGWYYVEITGNEGNYDQSTPYEFVATLRSSEPPDVPECDSIMDIVPNEVVTGTLREDNQYDFYKIEVTQLYTILNMELTHPTKDYDMRLYYGGCGAAGNPRNVGWAHNIGPDGPEPETVAFDVGQETGSYYIEVSGFQREKDPENRHYTLVARLTPDSSGEPNDACASAFEVAPGGPVTGTLSAATDKDYFKVNVPDPNTVLKLHLLHPTQDYDLKLYNGGCDVEPIPATPENWIAYHVGTNTGWYTATVTSHSQAYYQSIPYSMTVEAAPGPGEPDDTCANAYNADSGVDYMAQIDSRDDVDFYRIHLTHAYATLNLSLFHPTMDYDLTLYPGSPTDCEPDKLPIPNARGAGLEQSHYNIGTNTGWYYVAVKGFENPQSPYESYRLTLTETPDGFEPDNSCGDARSIEFGATYSSSLSYPGDEDLYKVSRMEEARTLIVTLTQPPPYELEIYRACPSESQPVPAQVTNANDQVVARYDIGADTGSYYLRVHSPTGQYSSEFYSLTAISTMQEVDLDALIVVNQARLEHFYGFTRTAALMSRLEALQGIINGRIVDVGPLTTAAYAAWDANPGSSRLANVISHAIKARIRIELASVRGSLENKSLVIVGDDRVIPFRRVRVYNYDNPNDRTWMRENQYDYPGVLPTSTVKLALQDDQTLTDDFYADLPPSMGWRSTHTDDFYIPDLAIGRLVETPEQIMAVIDDFMTHNRQITLTMAEVSGYSFLKDVAERQCRAFGVSDNCSSNPLISDNFTAASLSSAMFSSPKDLASINGHTTHQLFVAPNNAPDNSTISVTDIPTMTRRLVLSLGCHSGLNLPPDPDKPLLSNDLPEAFATLGASAYVGSTGWAWGSDRGIDLGEDLMARFAEKLVTGEQTFIGKALADAKRHYVENRPLNRPLDYYDEKTLIGMTLFGLPMLRVNTAQVVPPPPELAPLNNIAAVTTAATSPDAGQIRYRQPASNLIVQRIDRVLPELTEYNDDRGRYYELNGQVMAGRSEPIQPLFQYTVKSSSGRAHGLLLLSATYYDQPGFDPVIAASGYSPVSPSSIEPTFSPSAPGFYPTPPHRLNTYQHRDGGRTDTFVLTAGQFDARTSTERLYKAVTVEVFYSDTADETSPHFEQVRHGTIGNQTIVSASVNDGSGVQRVLATYTTGSGATGDHTGTWQSVELVLGSDNEWSGALPAVRPLWYFVQAVDVAGNVAVGNVTELLTRR